jgi:hypothetical protein
MANQSMISQELPSDEQTSCSNSSHCLKALDSLIRMWQMVCNAINVPLSKDLGSSIANYNFLLENYYDVRSYNRNNLQFPVSQPRAKELHTQITRLMSILFPDLHHDKIMFVDMLGLFGFETTFGFEQWSGTMNNYQEISSILYPQFGFDQCNKATQISFKRCFDDGKKQANNTDVCELSVIYCEWVYYLCNLETIGGIQGMDNEEIVEEKENDTKSQNGTY